MQVSGPNAGVNSHQTPKNTHTDTQAHKMNAHTNVYVPQKQKISQAVT